MHSAWVLTEDHRRGGTAAERFAEHPQLLLRPLTALTSIGNDNLGLRSEIWDFGFDIWVLGFEIWVLGFGIWDLKFEIWDLRCGFWVLGFWDLALVPCGRVIGIFLWDKTAWDYISVRALCLKA